MLEHGTHPVPLSNCERVSRNSSGVAAATGARSGVQSMPAIHNCDSAIRHGLRTAASPPGNGTGSRWPTRTKRWLSVPELENLAAPYRLIAAVAGAVEGDSDDRFADTSVLGQQRHHVRMVVLD